MVSPEDFDKVLHLSIDELQKKKFGISTYDRHINGVIAFHLAKNHIQFDTADLNKIIASVKKQLLLM